ncbi:conserved domain-containing protein [Hymenobacter gelipurpurascens]|uniref:Conserved domain-containing protein n=1 Tax=Hymenobacter gelipurpurascens TaxID=89968 RepID=A0A212UCL2_9BACT|nr:YsnF/AvaK domain-containing protein [Hymenobacter gelipurpurascens]SNC75977.1 conserved domain-containing protein [Hymenobacter gelipurpurascens]
MSTTPTSPIGSDDRLSAHAAETVILPVIEEQAIIRREVVETGRVHLTKKVEEHEETLNFTLLHDEVKVERVPINAFVADGATLPGVRYEGDTMIIPVVREVVVKRMLVVEELHVTKHEVPTQESHTVVLRQESVQVQRESLITPSGISPAENTAN